MKAFLHVSICFLLLSGVLVADEGMWLFNALPAAKVKYGFEPDAGVAGSCAAVLGQVQQRLGVVRLRGRADLHEPPHRPGLLCTTCPPQSTIT